MQVTRVIFQTVFFLLFWYLLIITAYPLTSKIPVDIFLRADPLAALVTSIVTHTFSTLFIPAIVILILTLFFGRWFCGWICPLGSHIDLIDRFKWRKSSRGTGSRAQEVSSKRNANVTIINETAWRKLKFYGFLIFIILAILGVQMIWVLDPLVLITRSMTLAVYPYLNLILRGTFDTLYNVPAVNQVSEPVYGLLKQGFLAFNQPVYLNHLTFAMIIILVFGATILTPRFWCRYLCPLGALLGWVGKFSLIKRRVEQEKCFACLVSCVRRCRTDSIRAQGKSYLPLECVGCMDCVSVCPTKAVHFGMRKSIPRDEGRRTKEEGSKNFPLPSEAVIPPPSKAVVISPQDISSSKTGITRRGFIYVTTGSIIAIPALKLNTATQNVQLTPIRPPGINNEEMFLDKCVRCAECMKVCPTNGLQPTLLQSGWQGVWSPQLVPRIGYCEFECTLCSQVCPSGAIERIPLEKKKKTIIGTAYIDKSKCIPYIQPTSCLVCEEMCPVPTKAIEFIPVTVRFKNIPPKKVLQPYVVKEKCIGCGICETKCPIQGTPPAIYVVGTRIQTETA
ncbi:MAG: 4Fe-4S binding protein [bacterium]|nr:4Fe-4S binding protein [bacterium]